MQSRDPLGDGKSLVELVDHMGDDLSPVNAARISFGREKSTLNDADIKLLRFLAKHKHTSPFRHSVLSFKVKAPLAIARQWWKHAVASTHVEEQNGWNEQSLRYVQIQPDFYIPSKLRLQSTDNRQASNGHLDDEAALQAYLGACEHSFDVYQHLLQRGVCREQARMILPAATYTSWVWTASLQSVLHFCNLRNKPEAQGEMVEYAKAVEDLSRMVFPVVFTQWLED